MTSGERTAVWSLITAARRYIGAYEADAAFCPNMPVLIAVETNSNACEELTRAMHAVIMLLPTGDKL